MDKTERELQEFFRAQRLTDGLADEVFEPAVEELVIARRLIPALREERLVVGLAEAAEDDVLDEYTVRQRLAPALRSEVSPQRAGDTLANRILARLRKKHAPYRGIPYIEWLASAFAVGFAAVVVFARSAVLREILTGGRWPLLVGAFGVFLSAVMLLFNAGRLVRFDEKLTRPVFGPSASGLLGRFEMFFVQAVGTIMLVVFCRLFLGVTTPNPFMP